ncbi:hypothetical protein ACFFWC_22050 [Plantactinospora siamensis]|uniref:SUKH-3 immunity protein of toxin-antitoxin system n=1 Tax=Plantactinospora siamensis TaxID=555372 RepID=A0ABV6NY73_9ACTN
MDRRWPLLARTLEDLGMWRHLPAAAAAEQAREVAAGGYPFRLLDADADVRWFFVDGEEMAEGRVPDQLRSMAPALLAHGVELRFGADRVPSSTREDYVVTINGRPCRVWGPEDWTDYRAWETATVRPLAVVNDLLGRAGAVPRLCTLYAGGNDGIAWLLDPRIVAAVERSGLLPAHEVPRLAADLDG